MTLRPMAKKVIALETAGTNITANALCPGWVMAPPRDSDPQKLLPGPHKYSL